MKEIELSKRGTVNRGKYKAKVDDDIFEEVNKFNWSYNKGYAQNRKLNILLHVYIWTLKFGNIPSGLEVEHKNQDKLDCRLDNLRLATRSENACNITKRKNNKSGVKGLCKIVRKSKDRPGWSQEKWKAQIRKDERKKTKKGYVKEFPFTDDGFEQAKEWIKQKTEELHKEFSIYNEDK